MKKYLKIGDVATQLGVSPQTVRRYEAKGLLVPIRSITNQRLYLQSDVDNILGKTDEPDIIAFYVRESNVTLDHALEAQQQLLEVAFGTPTKVFKDKASGLNENRKGLNGMLEAAKRGEFNVLCIAAKDRLTRFGYTYLEQLLKNFGVRIQILEDCKILSAHEELIQDFMSLLASFSGKYYRLRSNENKLKFLKDAEKQIN